MARLRAGGLAFLLLFGAEGWFGGLPFDVVFALPGMVLATIFVSLPFVVREVVPVLREIGDEQEQAAATLGASGWQTFWRVTLPAIRWGIAYGVVLTTGCDKTTPAMLMGAASAGSRLPVVGDGVASLQVACPAQRLQHRPRRPAAESCLPRRIRSRLRPIL